MLSSALERRACDALEDAARVTGRRGDEEDKKGRACLPLPPTGSISGMSGLFRRAPTATFPPLPAAVYGGVIAGKGGGGAREESWLGAVDVKRGLRFCMKVHRFREMCRPGSCVAARKVRSS